MTDEKPLAAAAAAAQTDTQHVNREGPNVRRRRQHRPTSKPPRPENLLFAERLSAAMKSKNNMSPSDLAKLVWGTTKDRRGYIVARNRDRVGHYLAGTSYPDPANLEQIAKVLDIPLDELEIERPLAKRHISPRQAKGSEVSSTGLIITALAAAPPAPSRYRVQVDRGVSHEQLIALLQLLEEAKINAPLEEPGDPQLGKVINGSKA